MSQRSFQAELARCSTLALDFLVTHPGNATDGDVEAGLERVVVEVTTGGVAGRLEDLEELTRPAQAAGPDGTERAEQGGR